MWRRRFLDWWFKEARHTAWSGVEDNTSLIRADSGNPIDISENKKARVWKVSSRVIINKRERVHERFRCLTRFWFPDSRISKWSQWRWNNILDRSLGWLKRPCLGTHWTFDMHHRSVIQPTSYSRGRPQTFSRACQTPWRRTWFLKWSWSYVCWATRMRAFHNWHY